MGIAPSAFKSYALSTELADQMRNFTRHLGLEYGAIDLIRQPDGTYVFLEINPQGQFLFAEKLSGVPITNTLADLLMGFIPPLNPMRSKLISRLPESLGCIEQ
jgi:glutathione synthase/RimK-type ligase-like ATP-grasp enzyme